MNNPYLEKVPSGFPQVLLTIGQKPLGVNAIAWPYPAILDAVGVLAEHGMAILGGDVYRRSEQGLILTYDNWSVDRRKGSSWIEYVKDAAQRAISYIEAFHATKGDEFWYSVGFARD